uniref:Uncharacterized protein n=1 Tax=Siphoviridae sp. ctK9J6 TaxID=2825437 RepID=A0A8S5Q8X2_9CAUD|nr:MAG TPA: hypothetical protein [Siphoviridae sp. ctK9J6]
MILLQFKHISFCQYSLYSSSTFEFIFATQRKSPAMIDNNRLALFFSSFDISRLYFNGLSGVPSPKFPLPM